MMNHQTRISKMPEEVRAEISPWFIQKKAIKVETPETIQKLDNTAKNINSKLQVHPFPINFLFLYITQFMMLPASSAKVIH